MKRVCCVCSIIVACLCLVSIDGFAEEVTNHDFESGDFTGWKVEGDAFGAKPLSKGLSDQFDIRNFDGKYFANSFHNADGGRGKLTSEEFTIANDVMSFLIAGGHHPRQACVNLVVDGKIVKSSTGDNSEKFKRSVWDVSELIGRKARVEVVDRTADVWGYVMFDDLTLDALPNADAGIDPEFYRFDVKNKRYAMLIGSSSRGMPGGRGWYSPDYGIDSFTPFQTLFDEDGWNSFIFVLNDGRGSAQLPWDPKVESWKKHRQGNMGLNISAAEEAGIVPVVELLVGGIANKRALKDHPDWQAVNESGAPHNYMGPHVCTNSPYWKDVLLPLYKDFFEKYGDRVSALVVWEYNFSPCHSDWCKKELSKSGISDFRAWSRKNMLKKCGELSETIRATGWKGKIIGGGWAAYEWEENMWDSTLGGRQLFQYNIDELEAFRKGYIDIIKPELLIHSTYGPHKYRREDAHYVYRSLMYERSIFGDNIIPNVETFWDGRTMTPDELFRWMLEVWSAGYNSYSLVGEAKLYLEHYTKEQDEYRLPHRNTFSAFSSAPSFGKPVPNFQFVVSLDLEKSLFYRETAKRAERGVFESADFSIKTLSGKKCLVADKMVKDYAPRMQFTLDPNQEHSLVASYLDNTNGSVALWIDYIDGGDWKDYRVGTLNLASDSQFKSVTLSVPPEAIAKAGDSDTEKGGKQISIRLWEGSGNWLSTPIAIESIELKDKSGKTVSMILPSTRVFKNSWDWYVKETCRLFKQVDRTVCGGAIVNEKITDLDDEDLYGIVSKDLPRILIIPEGCPEPKVADATNVKVIRVEIEEDLSKYAPEIIEFVKAKLTNQVTSKSPLVYVNWNKTKDGETYISVINHANEDGFAKIRIPSGDVEVALDSEKITGSKVNYKTENGWLKVKLAPYASVAFKEVSESSWDF